MIVKNNNNILNYLKISQDIYDYYESLVRSDELLDGYSLGFVNYNHHSNNSNILLQNAIKSFFKYNKIDNDKILIVHDNKPEFNITFNNGFVNYDYNLYSKPFDVLYNINIDLSHCLKIDLLTHFCKTKYLILCDCDIIFKKSLDKYLTLMYKYDIMGTIEQDRIVPFLLFLNIDSLRKQDFYFSDIFNFLKGRYVNTGSNLLKKISHFTYNNINIYDIIYHYGAASQDTRLDKSYYTYLSQLEYIHKEVQNLSINEFMSLC